jgi:transcriptional regulator with XRE-family HTH domain
MINKIKQARKAAGFTQCEMCEELGIPLSTIKAWDSDKSAPPEWAERLIVEKLKKIAEENLKAL